MQHIEAKTAEFLKSQQFFYEEVYGNIFFNLKTFVLLQIADFFNGKVKIEDSGNREKVAAIGIITVEAKKPNISENCKYTSFVPMCVMLT